MFQEKKFIFFCFFLFSSCFLFVGEKVEANIMVDFQRITNGNNIERKNPKIFENRIVWQEKELGVYNSSMYLYDLENSTKVRLPKYGNYSFGEEIDICGNKVIWRGNNGWIVYDITDIHNPLYQENRYLLYLDQNFSSADICGDIAVFAGLNETSTNFTNGVYFYNLNIPSSVVQGMQKIVEYDLWNDFVPEVKISGEKVVWVKMERVFLTEEGQSFSHTRENFSLYLFDLNSSPQEQKLIKKVDQSVADSLSSIEQISIFGNKIVWRERDSEGKTNIYLYDILTSTEYQVSSNYKNNGDKVLNSLPVIYDNKIVWRESLYEGGESFAGYSISMYDINTGQKINLGKPEETFGIFGIDFFDNKIVLEGYVNGSSEIFLAHIKEDDSLAPEPPVGLVVR